MINRIMKAEIISIGSELVNGQALDTNSQWLSRALGAVGVPVRFHTTLSDDLEENVAAFRVAMARAGFVVVTGGLGPTQDDLTREVLAALAGVPLVEDAQSLIAIEAMFARRQRAMPERNRVQARRKASRGRRASSESSRHAGSLDGLCRRGGGVLAGRPV